MAASFSANLAEARLLRHRANVHLSGSSHELALPVYLQAAELYSLAVRQAPPDSDDKKKAKQEFAEVLVTAKKVKAILDSTKGQGAVRAAKGKGRCDQDSQAVTLLQSSAISTPTSKLNLPLWTEPGPSDFASTSTYSDPQQPPLPASFSAAYARPPPLPPSTPIWSLDLRSDSVEQDIVADCSFVAGVQAALAWSSSASSSSASSTRSSLLSSAIYPRNPSTRIPIASSNSLHYLRLCINGAWRRVTVDASLPVSTTGEQVGIRVNDADAATGMGLRLLEKGWLKVMGGWDFPGSNSSIDLHALTGWIPETVGIKVPTFQREKTWNRLHDAHLTGTVLITIGTGRLSPADMSLTGLIPRHDYAVQELIETEDGRRSLKIINPWRRARREAESRAEQSDASGTNGAGLDGGSWTRELRDSLNGVGEDGSFILSWETVCATFDALYLNWDPSAFKHTRAVHSSWRSSASDSSNASSSHPQIILHPTSSLSDIWLLLTRHLTDVSPRPDDRKESISLQTFEDGVARTGSGGKGAAFTDSPHVLVRVRPRPTGFQSPITLVLSRDGPTDIESRFTISGFSDAPFTFSDVPPPLPYRLNIRSEFLGRTAGGSPAHPTFLNNPTYRLEIKRVVAASNGKVGIASGGADVKVCLETEQGSVPVGVMLLWGKGERVESVTQADVIADSGLYNDGIALAGQKGVAPGIYTLVLSTFLPKQETPFTLLVESTLPIDLKPIPLEGAGMFLRTVKGVWSKETCFGSPTFGSYHRNPTYKIVLDKPLDVFFRLSPVPSTSSPPTLLPLNLTIFLPPSSSTSSPLGEEVLTTGPYSDAVCGVCTPKKRLEKGEYLVVVSCYGPWSGGKGEKGEGVGWEVKGWSEGGKVGGWERV